MKRKRRASPGPGVHFHSAPWLLRVVIESRAKELARRPWKRCSAMVRLQAVRDACRRSGISFGDYIHAIAPLVEGDEWAGIPFP